MSILRPNHIRSLWHNTLQAQVVRTRFKDCSHTITMGRRIKHTLNLLVNSSTADRRISSPPARISILLAFAPAHHSVGALAGSLQASPSFLLPRYCLDQAFRPMLGIISLYWLVAMDSPSKANDTQGAKPKTPARSAPFFSGRGSISGCGWVRCKSTAKARFPPAESPPMITLEGSRPPWFEVTIWRSASTDWRSAVGYSAGGESVYARKKMATSWPFLLSSPRRRSKYEK